MPEIITRAEAKARGLKRYFTGLACSAGHISERYTDNYGCCKCRLESYDKFCERNPEYRKEAERKKYGRRRERYLAYHRKYYEINRDSLRKRQNERNQKIQDLLLVLKEEMPELLKEFGL